MISARQNGTANVANRPTVWVNKREGVTMGDAVKKQGAKVTADVIKAMREAKSDVDARKQVATSGNGRKGEIFRVNDKFDGALIPGPNAEAVFTWAVRLGPGKAFTRDEAGAALPGIKCARWTVGRLAKAGAFTRS